MSCNIAWNRARLEGMLCPVESGAHLRGALIFAFGESQSHFIGKRRLGSVAVSLKKAMCFTWYAVFSYRTVMRVSRGLSAFHESAVPCTLHGVVSTIHYAYSRYPVRVLRGLFPEKLSRRHIDRLGCDDSCKHLARARVGYNDRRYVSVPSPLLLGVIRLQPCMT